MTALLKVAELLEALRKAGIFYAKRDAKGNLRLYRLSPRGNLNPVSHQ